MKLAPLLSILLLAHAAAFGRDTAYKALRVLGNERGQSKLNRVIEVQGRNGAPQPAAWKIVLDDPSARGGVREFEVEKGRIASERAPVRTYSGSAENAVMDFQKLNLDSAGAFTIANKEANRAQVGFDSVDYVLRNDDETRAPVWVLRLLDSAHRNVGTIHIAAENGSVLLREGFGAGPRISDEEFVPNRAPRDADEYDENGRPVNAGREIKKGFIRAGASIEEFFTGNRTLDRRYRGE